MKFYSLASLFFLTYLVSADAFAHDFEELPPMKLRMTVLDAQQLRNLASSTESGENVVQEGTAVRVDKIDYSKPYCGLDARYFFSTSEAIRAKSIKVSDDKETREVAIGMDVSSSNDPLARLHIWCQKPSGAPYLTRELNSAFVESASFEADQQFP